MNVMPLCHSTFCNVLNLTCRFRVQKYIEALTSKTKPKLVLVCMIYYPDETNVPSWASPALGALSYNSNPQKLQLLIRKSFVEATSYVYDYRQSVPQVEIHCHAQSVLTQVRLLFALYVS